MDEFVYRPEFEEGQIVTTAELIDKGLSMITYWNDEELWFKCPFWYRVKHYMIVEVYGGGL